MSRSSTPRRPPTMYALIGVSVLAILGVALFVWGPINPNVSVDTQTRDATVADWLAALTGNAGSFGSGQSIGPDGRAQASLVVTNHSIAPVELVSIRTAANRIGVDNRSRGTLAPSIVRSVGVPVKLAHGSDGHVSVTVDARKACLANHGGTVNFQILIEARTASGIVRTIGGNGQQSVTCSAESLPAPGPGPANPASARAAISRAFDDAYDYAGSPQRRRAAVDDPAGLDGPVGQISSGPYAAIAKSIRVRIIEVVFTRPDRAAVLYDLTGVPGSIGAGRIGHARYVDGRWKVTRATVCADLSLGEVHCPPG